jgi:ABC-type nitrate/sulfonate/bicarbonate transport system substrate-binding protein
MISMAIRARFSRQVSHRNSATRFGQIGILFVALLAGTLAACSSGGASNTVDSSSLPTVTFLLPGGSSPMGAPVIYAQDAGLFKKYGVNVQVENPSSAGGATTVQYIQQGRFDMGYVSVDQLLEGRQKGDFTVQAFYGWIQRNARCLMVPTKDGITTPQGLAGRTVGLVSTTNNTSTKEYLQQAGVLSKVKFESLSQSASTGAYLAGKVDAVAGYGFQQVPALTEEGVPSTGLCEYAAGMHYMQAVIGATQSFLSSHKTEVQAVANGLTAALNAMASNPSPAIALFKKADTDDVTPPAATLNQEVKLMLVDFKTPNDSGHDWGWMSPTDWNTTKTEGETLFGLKPSFNVSTAYTDAFTK